MAICLAIISACSSGNGGGNNPALQKRVKELPDTLVVGTLYSPTSYFIYRDQPMGYDYELISKFCADNKLPMRVKLADNFHELIEMLRKGEVHILAYEIPKTAEYNKLVLHCGPQTETHQVLVQRVLPGSAPLNDVTQLPGKKIYVEKDSKYYYRLQNLNREVGGGIEIMPIGRDSVMTEDMIAMVATGEIPLTVVDSDIARISRTYYDNIDVSMPVGMAQTAYWAVAPSDTLLARTVDQWTRSHGKDADTKAIYRRYYELSKNLPDGEGGILAGAKAAMEGNGRISAYDEIFRRYAAEIGWDWRLLAAQAYNESRFNVEVVSWAGARGLMQLMPATAKAMGLPLDRIKDPELNVKAAVKAIKALDSMFASKVRDPQERKKFVVAAYNSGGAHILDAIVIAGKAGKNPAVWDDNVEQALLLKSNPEFYRDPDVKYGYFKGTQTVEYVKRVMATFAIYKANVNS